MRNGRPVVFVLLALAAAVGCGAPPDQAEIVSASSTRWGHGGSGGGGGIVCVACAYDCGGLNQPACVEGCSRNGGPCDTAPCGLHLGDFDGVCKPCGDAHEPACPVANCTAGPLTPCGTCSSDRLNAVAITTSGAAYTTVCLPCGDPGQDECQSGAACTLADKAVPRGDGTCVSCGSAGYPACDGTCYGSGIVDKGGMCLSCGNQNDPVCAGNVCNAGFVPVKGYCAPCGEISFPECLVGAACDAAKGAVPQRGYDVSVGVCVECGSCGEQACLPSFPNECGGGLTPFPSSNGATYCWLGAVRKCATATGGSGGSGGGGSGGKGGGGSGGKGGGGSSCDCTPTTADDNLSKCGAGLYEPCDPRVSTTSSDKSLLCRPTLGCVPDANGQNFLCRPPTPDDNWTCNSGGNSELAWCWSSSQVGLCEGVSKGSSGS